MDHRHLAHLDADPDFYDDVWQVAPAPGDVLGPAAVPDRVEVTDHGPWRIYRTPVMLPDSGWKVHVSCVPTRARDVVATVVAEALAEDLTCKHLRSRRLVAASQAKYADPSAAGKVVTIYTAEETALARIVARLTARLAGEPGARILSDIPVDGAPVSVRFGAFRGVHHVDALGRCAVGRRGAAGSADPVADDRSPHSGARAAGYVPEVVAILREAAAARDADAVLPVTDVRLMHRSNAGGVYSATWEDGRRVVLKEARRHTGFDASGSDAVTRLRHERRALERLAGTGVVPEVVRHHVAGDSEFLVLEHVDGPVLTSGLATRHPAAVPGADGPAYRHWVERVVSGTRASLEVLHAHGVTHRDVHSGNVIDRDGRMVLVDLESAAVDGVAVAEGVGTVLSSPGADVTPQGDLDALERMRAVLVNPQYSLTSRRPDLAAALVRAGESDLDDAEQPVGADDTEPTGPDPARLLAGLRVAADPTRTDRLLPSDVAGFAVPGGGLGLLHGAGGVLATLARTGAQVPDEWRAWLVARALEAPYLAPGLGDGAEGVALCLSMLGEDDASRTVLERWADRSGACPWWSRGAAGRAVALAELSARLDDPSLAATALGLATEVLEAVETDVPPPGHRAGLLDGWAGVGLALLRVAELTAGAPPGPGADLTGPGGAPLGPDGVAARLRAGARAALRRETGAVRVSAGAWLTGDGRRVMPYLGTGSAALGLLAAALGEDGDPEAVRGVRLACSLRSVAGAGLLHGRAGLLATLTLLAPDDPVVATHRRRLAWYTVPAHATGRREHPEAAEADLVLGDQNMRCAADVGSGAAGVLLVADPDPRRAAGAFSDLLCLPRAGTGWHDVTDAMTPVTTGR
ncbi:hypothetical protein KC207_04310 [Phycicoccus sp. BSK3Z-2]|uniref:RamC N-terminal domain-containing protein n=1 Tax=Phycicoccus avicenniae TaxID=2828860 RepID=A0A941D600_9MICO|nr:hypothetical protein [Phycicoccus avicenniae]MBR7742510.1 hypothetical protein [Phycicoccus avicenniae]